MRAAGRPAGDPLVRGLARRNGASTRNRIGLMGFSAGGEVTAPAYATTPRRPRRRERPGRAGESRPDFQALVYSGPQGIRGATVAEGYAADIHRRRRQDNFAVLLPSTTWPCERPAPRPECTSTRRPVTASACARATAADPRTRGFSGSRSSWATGDVEEGVVPTRFAP